MPYNVSVLGITAAIASLKDPKHIDEATRAHYAALYRDLDQTWDHRAVELNRRLADAGLPVRVSNLSSIWTVWPRRFAPTVIASGHRPTSSAARCAPH